MKHYKTKQEVYMDLEIQAMQSKSNEFIVYNIKQLIKKYSNDKELGNAIRTYFIQNKL